MHLFGKQFYCIHEFQMFHFHYKCNGTSPRMAPETIVHLTLRVDGKGRCLFSVKRAKPPVATALWGQLNVSGNHLNDVRSISQLIKPALRYPACHRPSPPYSFSPFFCSFLHPSCTFLSLYAVIHLISSKKRWNEHYFDEFCACNHLSRMPHHHIHVK